MPKVLIVDDEPIMRDLYEEGFKIQGYGVQTFDGPDQYDASSAPEFDLFVIDLMMPTPRRWSNSGDKVPFYTGLDFAKELRADDISTPIVIFSTTNVGKMIDYVEESIDDLENVLFIRKSEFEPIDFARVCIEILRTGTSSGLNAGLGRRLAKAMILQPNIAGFGCDCKKFLKGSSKSPDD